MLLLPEDAWEMRGRAYSSDDFGKNNRGIFATGPIRAGTVVGDYLGLLIPNELEDEYETGPDTYLMYYDEHVSIWPDQTQPGLHIVNHSCGPNCGISIFRGHALFRTPTIHPEEELTVSYLLGPINDDCAPCRHACWCRARFCTARCTCRSTDTSPGSTSRNVRAEKPRAQQADRTRRCRRLTAIPPGSPGPCLLRDLRLGRVAAGDDA